MAAFTPLSWEQIKTLQHVEQKTRSEEEENRYRDDLQKTKKEWVSMKDFLLCDKFGLPRVQDEKTQQFALDPQVIVPATMVRFLSNPFGYTLQPGIEHNLLWMYPCVLSKKKIVHHLEKHRPSDVWEVIWFQNVPKRQSLKQVAHVHVFSRKK